MCFFSGNSMIATSRLFCEAEAFKFVYCCDFVVQCSPPNSNSLKTNFLRINSNTFRFPINIELIYKFEIVFSLN